MGHLPVVNTTPNNDIDAGLTEPVEPQPVEGVEQPSEPQQTDSTLSDTDTTS